jgi:hypothetical protein
MPNTNNTKCKKSSNNPCDATYNENHNRLCVICDSKLFGRSDKRFCSLECKNKYHSEIRKSTNTISNETMKILFRNHQILVELMGENCFKYQINKLVLQRKGFDFEVISAIEQNKFGFKLNVFDFSWYLSNHNTIVIYHNPKQNVISPYVYKRWKRFGFKTT